MSTEVDLPPQYVVAMHCIPTKKGNIRPVIIKLCKTLSNLPQCGKKGSKEEQRIQAGRRYLNI
ncbi:hypothetical protein DPMN_128614 [Dreissena polymorpha]|uniref:Uncharacterized protein n=1 Tax=Dreissena polymorpha TaxID=45954 RepID=A0A9D4GZV3_DREPO|nr:hypothetical protein DPMN_128614 [Dreissena polymorpha]